MTEWHEVWECPECGLQLAWGDHGVPVVASAPPTCTFGHEPAEMEQKLAQAFGVQVPER